MDEVVCEDALRVTIVGDVRWREGLCDCSKLDNLDWDIRHGDYEELDQDMRLVVCELWSLV